jgi:hypothetical protein
MRSKSGGVVAHCQQLLLNSKSPSYFSRWVFATSPQTVRPGLVAARADFYICD